MIETKEKYLEVLEFIFDMVQTNNHRPAFGKQVHNEFKNKGGIGDQFLLSCVRLGILKKSGASNYKWSHALCPAPSMELVELIRREMNQYNLIVDLQSIVRKGAEKQIAAAKKILDASTNRV